MVCINIEKGCMSVYWGECCNIKYFWLNLCEWLSDKLGKNVSFKTKDIIFGLFEKNYMCQNFCILHAKWFIHVKKQNSSQVFFKHYLVYLRGVVQYTSCMYIPNKQENNFNKYFAILDLHNVWMLNVGSRHLCIDIFSCVVRSLYFFFFF